jgi:hypothetical protein
MFVECVQYMRGGDRGDQMLALYNNFGQGKKAWKRILYYVVEVCVLKSYIIEGEFDGRHKKESQP